MKHFTPSLIDPTLVPQSGWDWIRETGDCIVDPPWTIRPHRMTPDEILLITPMMNQLLIQPAYVAIIMVPARTICKTHVDNIGGRVSALNIGVQIDNTCSFFEYMDGDAVVERITLDTPKVWAVDIPHRVDNSQYDQNRVVLSLGFTQPVEALYGSV